MHTKHADDEQWCWESEASGNFTVGKDPNYPRIARGTHVVLFLKQEQKQPWTDAHTINQCVKKHNEFIQYPILLRVEKEVEEDEGLAESAGEAMDEAEGAKVQDVTEEEEKKQGKRKVKKLDWELLNKTKPSAAPMFCTYSARPARRDRLTRNGLPVMRAASGSRTRTT